MKMNDGKRYQTKQRAQILSCLEELGSAHVTAADIAAKMQGKGIRVGLTTIYRCLDRMVEQGELRRYLLGSSDAACYQLSMLKEGESCKEHYHLKCEKCGRLIHAQCHEIDRFTEHMREEHGFTIDHGKTVFYGVCAECENKNKI